MVNSAVGPTIVWAPLVVILSMPFAWGRTNFKGGYITGQRVLDALDAPYEIWEDIVIESDSSLVVRPGVELRFAPGVGITVRRDGILDAKGRQESKILFTRREQPEPIWRSDYRESALSWPDVRLVDGDSILEGRLQIFYKDQWRSVCTNSKNWTQAALSVMCNQLGFSGGSLHRWFERSNDSSPLLYEDPQCTGNETSLFDCPNWSERQLGSGVCDYHYDIGIQCGKRLGNQSSSHWRGIKFISAKSKFQEPIVNQVKQLESLSSLVHVKIWYAGQDANGNATAAIDVVGQPPVMQFIDVKYSAYDAIHFFGLLDSYNLENIVIAQNRGHGIFANISTSQFTLNTVNVRDNGGDGIHFAHHESLSQAAPFCNTGNIGSRQTYPLRRSYVQQKEMLFLSPCQQVFEVASWTGQVLTVNFLGLSSDCPDSNCASRLEVYDGPTDSSRLLASVLVMNNTFPQSITSTRQKVFLKYKPRSGYYVSFVIEIQANLGRAYDLNVTDCIITSNNGRGIVIRDQRSGILVNRTVIAKNGHIAGLDVQGGSGDIMINNSFVTANSGDGINITFSGGYVHVDRTSIGNNTGRGVSFWFNETSNAIPFNHTVHITHSEVVNNQLYGIVIGNQCLSDAFWNISLNAFRSNNDAAIMLQSCWSQKKVAQSTVLITHNQFLNSNYLALQATPVLHTHLLVEHNEFKGYKRGVLYVNGLDDDDFSSVPAKVEIQFNFFLFNSGKFVANIGVFQGTSTQELLFTKNHLEQNVIKEPFSSLNPRSRVCAVVVVSSENVDVFRNGFDNVESTYELGSHVEKHNVIINATYNYWGSQQVKKVFEKLFDRKDRYNLAQVEFLPFLFLPSNLDATSSISEVHERDKIIPFKNGDEIGGEVAGAEFLERKKYIVKRDIFVRHGGKLHIEPGAVLQFDRSIGMMVQGMLISESDLSLDPIVYTIHNQASGGEEQKKVRLSGGTEGRLEVSINGGNDWGSVCDYGWDVTDAAIACHQLGYVLHPEDWHLEQSQFQHSYQKRFLISNVQCSIIDTDLTQCKSERDFENSCSTEVGIRCYRPSWSGLRLGMAAEVSRLKNVVVENAGLLDYSTNSFKAALQIDYNRHFLERLKIANNTDSGISIKWNEMFLRENRQLIDSELMSNNRHGIVLHSQAFSINRCTMSNNAGSGIHYNPMFSRLEQRDLVSWINVGDSRLRVTVPDDVQNELFINADEQRYIVFSRQVTSLNFQIKTSSGRSIGIVVLNQFNKASSENMIIYGQLNITHDVISWDVRNNLTSFPLRTPGYGVLVKYNSGRNPSGLGILLISSVEGQRNVEKPPTIHIDSAQIKECKHGFSSHHYNRDIGENGDVYHRYSNETILITSSTIHHSKSEAIFVWTPFWDPVIKNLAEVNYTIINSTIKENAKGLLHYSRDIRNSNNLFHWTINDTDIMSNMEGGIDIRLPYVWQYTENFTHSFSMHDCSLTDNRRFLFSVDGHFARFNMSRNTFHDNVCKKGILSISGMEKELLIENNTFINNSAAFGIEFNLQSHANKFGLVPASFHRNIILRNRDIGSAPKFGYQPSSYALGIRGVQQVNITRNLLDNINMQFELLTGVLTGSTDNKINVKENWWGTSNVTKIQKKIFDFDDWNGYAVADFSPFLGVPDREGGVLSIDIKQQPFSLDGTLSGRLFHNLSLPWRSKPYIVSSDLTIMPNVMLTIHAGVVIEFYPSVGILALGDVVAYGRPESPIVMRPVRIIKEQRFRRQYPRPKSRLCIDEKCEYERSDGFLEIYNATAEQWVPICDARFTERNAQVVCRELGYSSLNVRMLFGPRLDMGPTQTGRIRSWPHPLECVGTERSLLECEHRLNGYIDDYKCPYDKSFVYVYCGPESLPSKLEHWGGIRFSIPSFETKPLTTSRSYQDSTKSLLDCVHIQGAGVLHNEKSSAVQIVQREVKLSYVNITDSASHGVEAIAVPGSLSFTGLVVKDNMGVGLSFLSLAGESSEESKLGYDPLTSIDMSYRVFGMVDMCDTNKEMLINDRIIVYYKYDNQPVDCVKIFSSAHHVKQIGFRLLQFNLFDGKKYAAQPDVIQIFDGDVFNFTSVELASIGWQTGIESSTKFYMSSGSTLSVLLHTIGGSGDNGFIAEVVTLPISHPIARDSQHNVSYSEILNNGQEGIAYRSAGEITPMITLRYNRINDNGRELFGNFTSGDSAVLLDIQNAQRLYFYNNLVRGNQGGLKLRVDSHTSVSALRCLIVNNLFTENQNREALLVEGRKSGAFQFVDLYRNYFTRNYAKYRDTMILSQVVSNLTENMAYNNTGKHLLHVQGFQRMPLSYQTCQRNWFWKNAATDYWDKSTIIASKAGQRFNYNYLVNSDNDFELTAMNRTNLETKESPIEATMNWWGFNGTAAISGRIKDYFDFEELLEVKYNPYLNDNTSVLSGKCAGGWTKIGDTCFLYVGGIMTFTEAKRFCELDNASMPYIKTKHTELMEFVEQQQFYYERYYDKVWIQSIDIKSKECAVLRNRKVIKHPCNEFYPFLCERDPEITVSTRSWFQEPLTIAFLSVTSLAMVFVALCLGFWLCKSRQRYREKLERRNSIRASIRSNRSIAGFSELGYKRRLERAFEEAGANKPPELRMNGSVDSVEKAPSRFSCSMDDSYENTIGDTSTARVQNGEFAAFSFRHDPQHENATANLMAQPTFDLTYENQCFVDRSVSRNSHDVSRDWSSSTGSTLDMKRALENKDLPYHVGPYRSTPSPQLTSSRESNSRDGASSRGSSKQPPLETAM